MARGSTAEAQSSPSTLKPSGTARKVLSLFGWQVAVEMPPGPKCVVIVYPHTSNWDFVVGYLAKLSAGLPLRWVAKHTLFRWPFGPLLRRMGGIPVNRGASAGFVEALVAEFDRRQRMWLAITPEGTRSRTDHWKSGFYRLALAARVPVGLGFIDYGRRRVGIEAYLALTGNEEEDLDRIRAFYAEKVGKYPRQAGDIRFRD